MNQESQGADFVLVPTSSGGGGIVRRGEVVGGRANGADGSILYLRSGPSVYSSATIPQLARYFGAEIARID